MAGGRRSLSQLVEPRSIAVIGASGDATKPGGRALAELKRFGFSGNVYLVNNRRDRIGDMQCYASVASLPEAVDLAIVALPREFVLTAVEDCVASGVGGVLIYSSGFTELDASGAAIQDELTRLSGSGRTRIVGPNCQGILNVAAGISTSWADVFPDPDQLELGPVAWISQSGAIGAVAYKALADAGVGIAYWASTGNEADVTVQELIDLVIDDPNTRVVCGHVESIKDPASFRVTAERARHMGKPIILLKGGMSAAGARATQSHTGALTGDTRAYGAFFRQCGVTLVRDLDALVATASLYVHCPESSFASRVGIIATSGGMGAILADACADEGLVVAPLAAETLKRANELLPPFIAPANPLDVATGVLSDPGLPGRLVLELVEAQSHDQVIVCLTTLQSRDMLENVLDGISSAARKTEVPVALILLACHNDGPALARHRGIAVFTETVSPVRAMGNLHRWAPRKSAATAPKSNVVEPDTSSSESDKLILPEHVAKQRLARYGLRVPAGHAVVSESEALSVASGLRFPLVAKVSSTRLAHKTEHGAVRLGIASPEDLVRAFHDLQSVADALDLAPGDDHILIEEMAAPGIDVLVTIRRDPALGWIAVVAAGGELVEVMDDIAIRVLPIGPGDVEAMISELRVSRLLEGVRGRGPHDSAALVVEVLALAEFMSGSLDVDELELNPVRVHPAGGGVTILDALWTITPGAAPEARGWGGVARVLR